MKTIWLVVLIVMLFASSTCAIYTDHSTTLQNNLDRVIPYPRELNPGPGFIPSTKESKEDAEAPIITRCRAQELSPGAALAVMVVLATGCAIHMPGSLLISRRGGLY